MGLLNDVFSLILKIFCSGSQQDNQQQQQQPQQGYPGQQQQQQGYPPQQQPAWQQQPQHQQQQQPWQQQQQQQHHQQHHQQQQQQPWQQPHNGHAPSHPHTNGQAPSKPQGGYHGADPNQQNQHDPKYLALRADANREGDMMGKLFDQSHAAHGQGDGAGAKRLSDEARVHQRQMEALNKQASDWIFYANNTDSKPGEVDLHGLYVKEAIQHSDEAITEAKRRGDSNIHFIVGKGLHSQGGKAKLKPAIEDLMRKHNIVAELDPHNAGVLIAYLDGRGGGGNRGMNPDDISRRLDSKEDCTIM